MSNLESFIGKLESTENDEDQLLKADTLLQEMEKKENRMNVRDNIRKNAYQDFQFLEEQTKLNIVNSCMSAVNNFKKNHPYEGFQQKLNQWSLEIYWTLKERALLWVLCLYDLMHGWSGKFENAKATLHVIETSYTKDVNNWKPTLNKTWHNLDNEKFQAQEAQPEQIPKESKPEREKTLAQDGPIFLWINKAERTSTRDRFADIGKAKEIWFVFFAKMTTKVAEETYEFYKNNEQYKPYDNLTRIILWLNERKGYKIPQLWFNDLFDPIDGKMHQENLRNSLQAFGNSLKVWFENFKTDLNWWYYNQLSPQEKGIYQISCEKIMRLRNNGLWKENNQLFWERLKSKMPQ